MRANGKLVIVITLDLLDVLGRLIELCLVPHFEPLLQVLVGKHALFALPLTLFQSQRLLVILVLHHDLVHDGLLCNVGSDLSLFDLDRLIRLLL